MRWASVENKANVQVFQEILKRLSAVNRVRANLSHRTPTKVATTVIDKLAPQLFVVLLLM